MTTKSALRVETIQKMAALSAEEKRTAATVLARKLLDSISGTVLPEPRRDVIGLFRSLARDELPLEEILAPELQRLGWTLAFPKLTDDGTQMGFVCSHAPWPWVWNKGARGTSNPEGPLEEVDPSRLRFVVVPGLAWDVRGYRLGRGAGFYDRFLQAHPAIARVALLLEFQLLSEVPDEAHDQRMDWILTPGQDLRLFRADSLRLC